MNNLDGFGNPVAHILLNDRLVPVISCKAADLALMKDTYLQPSCSGGLQSLQKHITRQEVGHDPPKIWIANVLISLQKNQKS